MFQGSNYLSSMEALTAAHANFFTGFLELQHLTEDLDGSPPSPPRPSPPRAPAARATRHGTCPPGESRRRIGRHGPGIAQTPAGARRATPPTRESPCTPTRVPVRNPHASPNDRKAAPTPPRVSIHPTRIWTPTNPAPAPTGPVEPAAAAQTPAGVRRAIPQPQRRDPARHPSPAPHHMPRATPTDQPPLPAPRSCPPP